MVGLTTTEQWKELLDVSEEKPVIVFKHSATCPDSAKVYEELARAEHDGTIETVYRVVVQRERSVSNAIADDLGVQHESPQAFVILDRKPSYAAHHGAITVQGITQAFAEGSEKKKY